MTIFNTILRNRLALAAESKMFSWEEMGGMFASDKSDKELRDEYLEEKYGI